MKIGILLPRSGAYPMIGVELMEGLRSGLLQSNQFPTPEIVSGNIGFGESEKLIYTELERLFVIERADIVIAYIDMKVMALLEPLVEATGKLLIVLNAGANLPLKQLAAPGIIYLTLQQSYMCSLSGQAAGGSPAVFVSSFYDCGYLHGFAMVEAFNAAGGEVVFNFINNKQTGEDKKLTSLTEYLTTASDKVANILCVNGEAYAAEFYAMLDEYEFADKLNLFVSPMMLTEKAINGGKYRFSITGYSSWLPRVNNKRSDDFLAAIKRPLKGGAGIFLQSGFTAGLLLNELLKNGQSLIDTEDLPGHLETIELPGPGGDLQYDCKTGFFVSNKAYRCTLVPGRSELEIVPEILSPAAWEEFKSRVPENAASGWVNTYLCY